MIHAEAHSDDRIFRAQFDATPWFEHASDLDILKLAYCGWGGDRPADAVAEAMADYNKSLAEMFTYLEKRQGETGFECNVCEDDAVIWLANNRRSLSMALEEIRRGSGHTPEQVLVLHVTNPSPGTPIPNSGRLAAVEFITERQAKDFVTSVYRWLYQDEDGNYASGISGADTIEMLFVELANAGVKPPGDRLPPCPAHDVPRRQRRQP